MAKSDPADRAHLKPPRNVGASVVDLISNKTLIITEVDPSTSGENIKPVEYQTLSEVAEKNKPKTSVDIQNIEIKKDAFEESTKNITVGFGITDPDKIRDDFKCENIVNNADSDGEKLLLKQRLDIIHLEDFEKKLHDEKVIKLIQSNKEAILKIIEDELKRLSDLEDKGEVREMGKPN